MSIITAKTVDEMFTIARDNLYNPEVAEMYFEYDKERDMYTVFVVKQGEQLPKDQ